MATTLFKNSNPQVTEIARQPHREIGHYHCAHCEIDTDHAKVAPYEFPPRYHGELSAYVCLICGNWY